MPKLKIWVSKKELQEFKVAVEDCGGPEHNAFYELYDKVIDFIAKLEKRANG